MGGNIRRQNSRSVIRRGAAASTEKSTLKYQIIASYAPPATMPELIAF
jgi:hypothetical protein